MKSISNYDLKKRNNDFNRRLMTRTNKLINFESYSQKQNKIQLNCKCFQIGQSLRMKSCPLCLNLALNRLKRKTRESSNLKMKWRIVENRLMRWNVNSQSSKQRNSIDLMCIKRWCWRMISTSNLRMKWTRFDERMNIYELNLKV